MLNVYTRYENKTKEKNNNVDGNDILGIYTYNNKKNNNSVLNEKILAPKKEDMLQGGDDEVIKSPKRNTKRSNLKDDEFDSEANDMNKDEDGDGVPDNKQRITKKSNVNDDELNKNTNDLEDDNVDNTPDNNEVNPEDATDNANAVDMGLNDMEGAGNDEANIEDPEDMTGEEGGAGENPEMAGMDDGTDQDPDMGMADPNDKGLPENQMDSGKDLANKNIKKLKDNKLKLFLLYQKLKTNTIKLMLVTIDQYEQNQELDKTQKDVILFMKVSLNKIDDKLDDIVNYKYTTLEYDKLYLLYVEFKNEVVAISNMFFTLFKTDDKDINKYIKKINLK